MRVTNGVLGFVIGFAALQLALAQSVDHAADEKAIEAVIREFLDARDANDPKRLSAVLTADADQQQTSGERRRGRDAVVKGSLSTQQSTGGKRTIAVDSIRFIAADAALADGRYDSVGRADGSDLHMLTSIVLRRESGAWKIAAIRNMVPSGERAGRR
ncbi:MAG TPA: SgcJ/EcaC family oxidoreductase [Gammaproteobacteria bacterium]|nr:SgcJ/EcaC family oxidoreductase [Gammaproteobacteria bacterium]